MFFPTFVKVKLISLTLLLISWLGLPQTTEQSVVVHKKPLPSATTTIVTKTPPPKITSLPIPSPTPSSTPSTTPTSFSPLSFFRSAGPLVSRIITQEESAPSDPTLVPTITFSPITKTYGDSSFSLSPSSNSSGAFTFSSSDGSVATISGNTATIVGVGSATITATQATTTTYTASSTTATLTVLQATPVITFSPITKTYGDSSFSLSPSSNSPGSFTYTSGSTSVATISGSTVTIVHAGTSTITATQASTTNFLTASTTALLTVDTATPTFGTFADVTKQLGDNPFTLTAPSSNSAGAFTFSSANLSIATISGNTLSLAGSAGTVAITAAQAANGDYSAASTSMTLTVNNGYCENNPDICNSGSCSNLPDNGFQCTCSGSYGGQYCNECNTTYNTCKNGSACIPTISGALCQCTSFFCGISCSLPSDTADCQGGALEEAGPPNYGMYKYDIEKMQRIVRNDGTSIEKLFGLIDLVWNPLPIVDKTKTTRAINRCR